jgi:chromosome segregation ATPase
MENQTAQADTPEAIEARVWHLLAIARQQIAALPPAARTYQIQRIDATIDEFGKQEYERRLRLAHAYPSPLILSRDEHNKLLSELNDKSGRIAELEDKLATKTADAESFQAEATRANDDVRLYETRIDELHKRLAVYEPPQEPVNEVQPAPAAQPAIQE